MMNKEFLKEFVPYEVALRLKALGFDEPCFGYYNSNGEFTFFADLRNCTNNSEFKFYPTAPTFSQAFRWFRNKHKMDGWVVPFYSEDKKLYDIVIEGLGDYYDYASVDCLTHEEAEIICVTELIRIIESKSK